MANIASGFLSINFDKDSELKKSVVDEILNNLENNYLFTYGSNCDANFNMENRAIDLGFTGRWTCDSCWEWIENEISDGQNNVELSLEAKTILLNSEMSGGSFEYSSRYRDKVEKKNGARKFERYHHTELDSDWPQVLEIIGAYNLNQGDSKYCGNDVKITLIEKSEAEKYLFEIVGNDGITILIDKEYEEVEFFSVGVFPYVRFKSINEILEASDNGDLEPGEEPVYDWFGNGELIDDLIGQKDNCFRKKKGHKRK